jgi:hypothetical protein
MVNYVYTHTHTNTPLRNSLFAHFFSSEHDFSVRSRRFRTRLALRYFCFVLAAAAGCPSSHRHITIAPSEGAVEFA